MQISKQNWAFIERCIKASDQYRASLPKTMCVIDEPGYRHVVTASLLDRPRGIPFITILPSDWFGPDDDLVTMIPAEPEDELYIRADQLIATGGLTYDEYRSLQCAETYGALWAVVDRLESAALLRTVCRCGRRSA